MSDYSFCVEDGQKQVIGGGKLIRQENADVKHRGMPIFIGSVIVHDQNDIKIGRVHFEKHGAFLERGDRGAERVMIPLAPDSNTHQRQMFSMVFFDDPLGQFCHTHVPALARLIAEAGAKADPRQIAETISEYCTHLVKDKCAMPVARERQQYSASSYMPPFSYN